MIDIHHNDRCQLKAITVSEKHHPTGRQIAAARTLAGLSQADLARAASLSVPTLGRMEASEGPATGMANNVTAVVRALEVAGITFLGEGETADGGPGVRLSMPKTQP